MPCLSAQDLSKCNVAQPQCFPPPFLKQLHEPPGFRRQPRATPARASARGLEHLGAKHALHLADAIEARAITPPDLAAGRPNGPPALDGIEEPQIARSHEERPVPVEPQLVARSQVRAQRR